MGSKRTFSSALFASRMTMSLIVGELTRMPVAQSRAFQLMLAVWSKVSRGRPRCDALSYGVPRLSR